MTTDRQTECRAISPPAADGTRFMCDQATGHEGNHTGFELLTVTLDEPDDR